jgi:FAD/FMN-containing dehydrogenase
VHLPGDPAYDLASSPWNLRLTDHHPQAVAYPADADEVAEVVRAAAAAGLSVAPQGTGHGAPALGGRLGDAVLLRTSAMTELTIDPARRLARVGAGALWGDLAAGAGEHGLAALHPSSPDVGVVGYSLGGGIGWYARKLGLQCNAIRAAELVLADGTFVRATADTDAELFWALRGGGTPLGVVCSLEFDLHPIETVVAGFLAWDWTEVDRVLPAWVDWCAELPNDLTSAFRLLDIPDWDTLPADVRGRRLAILDGAFVGDDTQADELFAPLRELRPEVDAVHRMPAADLVRMHLEPEGPQSAYASSTLVAALPDAAIAAVIDAVGPHSGTSLTIAELRHLGGALATPDPDGGILSSLDGAFLALGVGIGDEEESWSQQYADAARFLGAVEPWGTGRTYLPMLDEVSDTRKAFAPDVHARLSAIRRSVDPEGLFMGPHPVPEERSPGA